MPGLRVYQLAKELKVQSALILELLDRLGKEVHSDLSSLDVSTAALVREKLTAALEHEKRRLMDLRRSEEPPAVPETVAAPVETAVSEASPMEIVTPEAAAAPASATAVEPTTTAPAPPSPSAEPLAPVPPATPAEAPRAAESAPLPPPPGCCCRAALARANGSLGSKSPCRKPSQLGGGVNSDPFFQLCPS